MKKKKFRFQWGAFLMFLLYGGLFFVLFLRIFSIQMTGEVEGQQLAAKAAAKYEKEQIINAQRGNILDRQGNIIAHDTLNYRLVAVLSPKASEGSKTPRHVTDPEKTAKVLAQYIGMDEKAIYKKLTSKNAKNETPYQVEFGSSGRDINHDTMTKIKQEELPGIIFVRDLKRFYPNGPFASHLVGFAQKEKQDDGTFVTKGQMGLEYMFDKELTGINGKVEYKSDLWGYLIPQSEKMVTPAKDGKDIYLTIDKTIQNFLEDAMNRVANEYKPESMTAIVADPKTGQILAMSQRPTFNPETLEGLTSNWLNEAVENTIEPGSTMKTFTLASAIEEKKWAPNATYASGKYKIADRTIKDWNEVGWGTITYLEGFQRSSNVAMANLIDQLGHETFIKYLHKFGFGEKTGIDLANEATGQIVDKYPINRITTAYGQGSTVTPIQLIQGLTAIANGGDMMQPYIIEKIVDPNSQKVVFEGETKVKGTPVSKETAKQVRELLASTITSEKGTGKPFVIEEYPVAGKTGTAQIPKPTGGYFGGGSNYLYSFLGMAPVDDPQLIMYIAIQKPKLAANEYGSIPTSKVFNSVMESSLKYLKIKPTDITPVPTTELPKVVGQNATEVQTNLQNSGLQVVVIGEGGQIKEQLPGPGSTVLSGSLVFLKTDGAVTLPNFTNWSLRNVLAFKAMTNLPIEIVGEGFVRNQSVSAGTVADPNTPIVVNLQIPEQSFSASVKGAAQEEVPQD